MLPGQLIAQRYRLEEQVGSGGMGVVWRATDEELRRVVAVKKSQAGDNGQIRREARIGAGVHHAHVVTVFDVVRNGEDRWLVMEYLPSQGMDAVLRAVGSLPTVRAATIGAQLAGAVAAMHAKGMVHRDIKPGNVLLAVDGTAKLTDLGIARWSEVTHTQSGKLDGTPAYLAPEVAEGNEAGPAADVFALGATIFAATTGHSPWGDSKQHGPIVQQRRAANFELEPLPDNALKPVLAALLSRHPDARPSAAAAQKLLASVSGDPELARPQPLEGVAPSDVTLPPPNPRRTRRNWLVAGVAAAVVVVAAGVVVALRPDHSLAGVPVADPPPAGSMLDPRTADPCSLLDPSSLNRFGTAHIDANYGGFNRCALFFRLPEGNTVETYLELLDPDPDPSVTPVRGKIGGPSNDPPKDDQCVRTITLPGTERVRLTTHYINGVPKNADPCGVAEAAAIATLNKLYQGPIPRRPPFPPESLANVNACDLLDGQDLSKPLGSEFDPERQFGGWSCYWGPADDQGRSAGIEFTRDSPLENPDEHEGKVAVNVAGRLAYQDVDEEQRTCHVQIPFREYDAGKVPEGLDSEWEEIIEITVGDDTSDATPDLFCPSANALAVAAVPRLPH
jgi:serine/threonine protein kinase